MPTSTTEAEITTTVTEVVAIPFTKRTVDDGALAKGTTVVRTAGRDGSKTVTWLVRTKRWVEVSRTVSGEEVTLQPATEVTAVGTRAPAAAPTSTPKPAPTTSAAGTGKCDPNYTGACVPIASDVDCSSGSGNGPEYVVGPVRVVGRDIYGLDSDGDGIGCEKG
jgi:resuscitation-promoting factor RpfB